VFALQGRNRYVGLLFCSDLTLVSRLYTGSNREENGGLLE
jgi:hypothetical protein